MKKRTQNKKVIKKDARKRLIILLLIFVSIASFLFIWVDSVIEDCKSKWTPIFDVCPALVRDDLSLCEEIINKDSTKEYLVVNCKEAINAIRIIRYNDIETCNKIEDKYQKDSCLAYVNKDIVNIAITSSNNNIPIIILPCNVSSSLLSESSFTTIIVELNATIIPAYNASTLTKPIITANR